jgi:hypothetical protein
MGVYLRDPAKAMDTQVLTSFTHGVGRHFKTAFPKPRVRNGQCGYDAPVFHENAVEVTHLLDLAALARKLGKHGGPKAIRDNDHSDGFW